MSLRRASENLIASRNTLLSSTRTTPTGPCLRGCIHSTMARRAGARRGRRSGLAPARPYGGWFRARPGSTVQSMATTVAVDIGGTFTDLVAVDTETGELTTVKEPSVPSNFVEGVAAALDRASTGRIAQFRHGTTVGTNAIIERTGARTGLITTSGFRDVLLAGRANKPDLYDSDWDPPSSLVA